MQFYGLITGETEKFFWKKYKICFLQCLCLGTVFLLPIFILLTIASKSIIPLAFLGVSFALGTLMFLFPKSKKEKQSLLPKKIYIKDDVITCVTDKSTETRFIQDIKCIHDYEEFYEIVFPFGKISYCFLCQKNLITEGTTSDFEQLFNNKILKK